MEPKQSKRLIEAALFITAREMSIGELARVCGSRGKERKEIEKLADELCEEYRDGGLMIQKKDTGYLMGVHPEMEEYVLHLAPKKDIDIAVLKVLALIAYRQPITQSDVIKIRGNKAYKYICDLKSRGLIDVKKHSRTKMLTTTPKFKEYFRIEDMDSIKRLLDTSGK